MSTSSILSNSIYQVTGGSIIAGFVDHLFPAPEAITSSTILMETVLALGQVSVLGLLTVTYFDFGVRRGIVPNGDPTLGLAYNLAVTSSSTNLVQRVVGISGYLRNQVTMAYTGPVKLNAVPSQYADNITNPQTNPGNKENAAMVAATTGSEELNSGLSSFDFYDE